MPITLITGTPGAGKTLLALAMLLKEAGLKGTEEKSIRAQLAEPPETSNLKRNVVVCGVEGLKDGLFDTMESPLDWQEYEDGTLFLVDECWKWFGSHEREVSKDARFLALAEHRHRGMDFIMTAQMPSQLQSHLRGLVSPHFHVARKFGTKLTMRYEWPSLQSSPNSIANRKTAVEVPWSHPDSVYWMYQSATMHTIKRRIPAKVYAMLAMAVLVVVGLGGAGIAAQRFVTRDAPVADNSKTSQSSVGGAVSAIKNVVSGEDYMALRVPRVDGIPSSAPLFDGREVTSYPLLFCMSEGRDGRDACTCITEQNTTVEVDGLACRYIARWGGQYDAYKPRIEERQLDQSAGATGAESRLVPSPERDSDRSPLESLPAPAGA